MGAEPGFEPGAVLQQSSELATLLYSAPISKFGETPPPRSLLSRNFGWNFHKFTFFMVCHVAYNCAYSLNARSELLMLWKCAEWNKCLKGCWKHGLETRNKGEPGRRQMLGNGLGPWRSRIIYSLNMQFLIKNLISFTLLIAKLLGDYFDIKGCGPKNDAMTHRSFCVNSRCGPNSQRK